jgi:nicotinamidase/pyrazinamidase
MMYGVKRLFVGGLATDYCVLATVRDALKQGLQVYVLTDAIRAVSTVDGERAIAEMAGLGAHFIESAALA